MTHPTQIHWTCRNCGFPIAPGQGVLAIPQVEINNPPELGGVWRPLHTTCTVDDYYGIDIEQVSDHRGLLRWTAHLITKPWIIDTNWNAILREALPRKEGAL